MPLDFEVGPQHLILLEQSEPSLYNNVEEHRETLHCTTTLHAVLGITAVQPLLESLFVDLGVQVVFHAAAYKHVPLVEGNPLSGLASNVLSTRSICQAAAFAGVSQVMLISTDQAVRPTNVMVASKRVAELVLQASALQYGGSTRFAMVRFGDVLGSSGSVVPLFRCQIEHGGPNTPTHPDIIRFFMTIPEAAQLVLQAAVLSEGGDVFLLDMGAPVRMKDLAEQLI